MQSPCNLPYVPSLIASSVSETEPIWFPTIGSIAIAETMPFFRRSIILLQTGASPDQLHLSRRNSAVIFSTFPVLFVQTIFNQGSDISHTAFSSVTSSSGELRLASLRKHIFPLPAAFPFTGSCIHCQNEIGSRLVTCLLDRFRITSIASSSLPQVRLRNRPHRQTEVARPRWTLTEPAVHGTPQYTSESPSEKLSAPTGIIMNSCTSAVFAAHAHRRLKCSSSGPEDGFQTPPKKRYSGDHTHWLLLTCVSRSKPPGSHSRPAWVILGSVRLDHQHQPHRRPRDPCANTSAITVFTFWTAFCTPFPPKRDLSPSRQLRASNSPVRCTARCQRRVLCFRLIDKLPPPLLDFSRINNLRQSPFQFPDVS